MLAEELTDIRLGLYSTYLCNFGCRLKKHEYSALVEKSWQGKSEILSENPIPVPLCLPQILHELAWDRTWASVVTILQIMSRAMTQPVQTDCSHTQPDTYPLLIHTKNRSGNLSAEKPLVAAVCSFQRIVLLNTVIAMNAETRIQSCLTTDCFLSNRLDINKRESLPIHYHTDKQQAWLCYYKKMSSLRLISD
jgi:hypothetical protein